MTVTTRAELNKIAETDGPYVILVKGIVDLAGDGLTLKSDKTVIGLEGAKIINGGFEIYGFKNIIIRNLHMDGNRERDDAIKIGSSAHHIWVDHCTLEDYDDGLLDITYGSSNVTASWNLFTDHDKTMLIGHSNNVPNDKDRLKVTVHHNWFKGTIQRHPRVRTGEVHVYNNLYTNINANISTTIDEGEVGYGIASTNFASVLVEGNYFQDVTVPTLSGVAKKMDSNGVVTEWWSEPSTLEERNNIFDNSGKPETMGKAFDPKTYYNYSVDDPNSIPDTVKQGAGVGVLNLQELLKVSGAL